MEWVQRAARATRYVAVGLESLVTHPHLLSEMWNFERALPARLAQVPLPELMAQLSAHPADLSLPPLTVCEMADAIAALDVRSPLGICLRRSLVRYYFLRRAGLSVTIRFGARFKESRDIGGHAWLVLDDAPYQEESENYQGFAVMYTYP